MADPVTAGQPDPFTEQDEAPARVCDFIREGMRAGRISSENGEVLIDAAEAHHATEVSRLTGGMLP